MDNDAKKKHDKVLTSSATRSLTSDFENITINNHLIPQAASTIQRKHGHKTRSADVYKASDIFQIPGEKPLRQFSLSSSLGILDMNEVTAISEFDDLNESKPSSLARERELAKMLLEKCMRQSVGKISEKNGQSERSNILSSSVLMNKNERNSIQSDYKSSVLGGISMSSSTQEELAQYGNDEVFNTKLTEMFQAEKKPFEAASIQEACTFSDVFSDLKLIDIAESTSIKSFGDYCKKKCGLDRSDLSNLDALSIRPSIGLGSIKSPQRKRPARKLTSSTTSTERNESDYSDLNDIYESTL